MIGRCRLDQAAAGNACGLHLVSLIHVQASMPWTSLGPVCWYVLSGMKLINASSVALECGPWLPAKRGGQARTAITASPT